MSEMLVMMMMRMMESRDDDARKNARCKIDRLDRT